MTIATDAEEPGSVSPVGPSPLLDVAQLRELLDDPSPPVLLDVRWRLGAEDGHGRYLTGHIPGAVYADLPGDLSGPGGPQQGRHPLPRPAALERTLRAWGVRAGSAVVAYDDAGSTSAARAWWLLRWAGIADVYVLDGGLGAWISAGGALELEEPRPQSGDVIVRAGSLSTLDSADAARLARDGVLLDARARARYTGREEPVDPVAGHVPGAISAPTTENLDEGGRFATPEALRARFEALGVDGTTPVGVYCGSGVTAAHEILALAVAGIDAVLYPPSWSGWTAEPGNPVATGDDP